MQLDEATLELLLRGHHIDTADRLACGLVSHPPIELRALVRLVARLVKRDGAFPRPWQPHLPGEPVDERGVIERRGPLRYFYRAQRHHPLAPTVLAETCTRWFPTPSAAARHYLRWELHLPGSLDGWSVE